MLPDRVSNPGPLIYESGALPIALRGPSPNDGDVLIYRSVALKRQSFVYIFDVNSTCTILTVKFT